MDDQLTLYYDELSRSHFWLTSKSYVTQKFIDQELLHRSQPQRIMEVGCCAGNFLQNFLCADNAVFGLDLRFSALKLGKARQPAINLTQANGIELPYRDEVFDMVILQDVLEHFADDSGLLRGLNRVVKPGGILFVCVPAYMWLYGYHDKLFGHVRRYTRPQLVSRLEESGFHLLRATYFQSLFLLPLFIKRRFHGKEKDGGDFVMLPKLVNSCLDWLLRLEAIPLKIMNLPFGPTLMCLAQKEGRVT